MSFGYYLQEIRIRYRGAVPGSANVSQRWWNETQREAWTVVGAHWHRDFLPKHFTRAGFSEYGYAPRSAKYERSKARRTGQSNPLVFSGELRDFCTFFRLVPTATRNRSGIQIHLPKAASKAFLRRPGSRVNMADELTRVSKGEAEQSVETYDRRFQRAVDTNQHVEEILIRGF